MTTEFEGVFQGNCMTDLGRAFGQTVTHNPSGGEAANVTGILSDRTKMIDEYEDGRQALEEAHLTLNPADVASMGLEDTFTISTSTWVVKEIIEHSPYYRLRIRRYSSRKANARETRNEH